MLAEQIGRALDYTTLRGDDSAARPARVRGRFNHVIGRSPAMAAVYEMIVRAAQTDATVLLHGETGTGKGLLARAIHVNSERRDAPFVHVDCTTLPAALVESELFGHERGAYTGADARVIGKVEAANGGTLFLDEIGELPLPLQGKLLRFVQERQFERVGGRETLTADVRLVAATNRDLAAMANAGPVPQRPLLPAARRRDRDPAAARARRRRHRRSRRALRRSSSRGAIARARCGSPTPRGPRSSAYAWPGNVRELENTIERAVVLAAGPDDRHQGSRPRSPRARVGERLAGRRSPVEPGDARCRPTA